VKRAGLYITGYTQSYTEAGLQQSKLWPAGTLCITIAANIADTAILGISACFPDSVIGFMADPTQSDARFVKYLFDATIKERAKQFSQGATQDNLSQEKLLSLDFDVPSVAEQTRIADILSTYDDLIENNRRRMALLEESARLLYREWFVRLRYPGYEHTPIMDGVPQGWDRKIVAEFFDTSSGGTPSRTNPEFYDGDINWVKTQELNDGFIFETMEKITDTAVKKSSAKLFPANTVLVSIYGGANIGRTGILVAPSTTNQACCALLPLDERAHYIFTALYFREQREKLISLSQGAAQTNISQQVVRALPITLPSSALMTAFVETLLPVFEQTKLLQLQNQKLRTARDLLLPRLMSGELAV
jgi:type I restriction enzyme S subunit